MKTPEKDLVNITDMYNSILEQELQYMVTGLVG